MSWSVNFVANGCATIRVILVFTGVFTFLVDAYPTFAASALAANSFMRSSFAGIFPLFGIQSKFVSTLLFPFHLISSEVCALHAALRADAVCV